MQYSNRTCPISDRRCLTVQAVIGYSVVERRPRCASRPWRGVSGRHDACQPQTLSCRNVTNRFVDRFGLAGVVVRQVSDKYACGDSLPSAALASHDQWPPTIKQSPYASPHPRGFTRQEKLVCVLLLSSVLRMTSRYNRNREAFTITNLSVKRISFTPHEDHCRITKQGDGRN